MFFTASMLHVHIMQWTDDYSVEKAVQRCDEIWQTISSDKVCYSTYENLFFAHLTSACLVCPESADSPVICRLIAAPVCSSTMRCCMFSIASGSAIIKTLSIMSTAWTRP